MSPRISPGETVILPTTFESSVKTDPFEITVTTRLGPYFTYPGRVGCLLTRYGAQDSLRCTILCTSVNSRDLNQCGFESPKGSGSGYLLNLRGQGNFNLHEIRSCVHCGGGEERVGVPLDVTRVHTDLVFGPVDVSSDCVIKTHIYVRNIQNDTSTNETIIYLYKYYIYWTETKGIHNRT